MGGAGQERTTRRLLACGAIGAPLFVASFLIQGATRKDYDPGSNFVSSLSNGPGGWVQIATFVVCGLLILGFAAGLRRRLRSGRGSTWAPRLIVVYALGVIGAGVFVADPGFGYPPGAPSGAPPDPSWHSALHGYSGAAMFFGLATACVVLAVRFWPRRSQRGWAIYSVLTAFAIFAFNPGAASEETRGLVQRVAIIAGWTWVTALAIRMMDPRAAIARRPASRSR